jgi:hypothetical protein
MVQGTMNWQGCGRKRLWPDLRHEAILSLDRKSGDLNRGLPAHEVGLVPIRTFKLEKWVRK